VKKVPEDPIGIIHHSWGQRTTGFTMVDMKTLKVRSIHRCLVNFHVQNLIHTNFAWGGNIFLYRFRVHITFWFESDFTIDSGPFFCLWNLMKIH